jgi:predicted permease
MYFIFLWEVLKRAFSPTARVTDVLQILAASTIPAIGKFAGISLPASANDDALAYIGLIAVSFIIIRLMWAPYSIWREQAGEIGTLKLELSKPERAVVEHLAKHRAEARVELIRRLPEMSAFACALGRLNWPKLYSK